MRSPDMLVPVDRVVAAQRGDRDALQRLVADHMTMLYNVAGRALGGRAEADDVVQETLLRVVENISAVRDPARFSGWILAILHRQVTDRMRRRQAAAVKMLPLDEVVAQPDPAADFTDATILRLHLSGQRRQIVQAVRWLDPDDRFLLSLWWLEVAGTICRADLVTALDGTPGNAAVRVNRMRDQLELSRCIVGALDAEPRCPLLADAVEGWDGVPGSVWRKRLGRHLRDCPVCPRFGSKLVPPEALLAGLVMLPLPPALAASTAVAVPAAAVGVSLLAKVTAAAVGAAVLAGAAATAVHLGSSVPSALPAPPAASATTTRPPASPSPLPSHTVAAGPVVRYGSVVDTAEPAPAANRRPARLASRAQGGLTIAASGDEDSRADVVSLIRRGQWVTYRGRGYLRVEWSVAYTQRTGIVTMPSWTGLRGRLFHVASGGGRRLDDPIPGSAAGTTGMGDDAHGRSVLPVGTQQMWVFEYYYLDGEVTLTSNERGADYNLYIHLATRVSIDADIRAARVPLRYGINRDDGTDGSPVPQYVTRGTPDDPATVAQRSVVR